MRLKVFILLAVISLGSINLFGGGNHHSGGKKTGAERRIEVKETIDHHLKDDYGFYITHHVGFPLPVILFDEGMHVFMSSKFHHGENVVESNGKYFKLHHGKIYSTDAAGTLEFDNHDHAVNTKPWDFSITKNVFSIIIFSFLMFLLFRGIAKNYRTSQLPKKAARFLEPIIVFVRDEIAIPNIGEKHYKRYMSFLLTVFFFIWFLNLLGMTPLGLNITGNLTVTAALALMTYFITTFTAKKYYWKHILWMPGVPIPLKIPLALIELFGTIIKPFSLMIRLYANMTAGHVVLMSILGLIYVGQSWIGGPLSFGLAFGLAILELLVAALQAYIFTMLSALYFGAAVEEDHH